MIYWYVMERTTVRMDGTRTNSTVADHVRWVLTVHNYRNEFITKLCVIHDKYIDVR